jgi:hypothetical protein
MNKLRKFLVVGVMVLSVIAMSGLVVAPAKAAASAGDLIKMDGLSSVYYLGSDGKRYVFPNEATYKSWHADFSGVVTISATELQSYPLGGNVTMRPGTKLVKITTDPSVYAVEPNGMLRKIQSEAQASALYGTSWSKRVVDVADSFFTNYTIGSVLADGSVPAGSLVKNANAAAVYYYDGTNYRSIASEAALAANRFMMGNIITVTNTLTAGGSSITGSETALTNDAQGGSNNVVIISGSAMVSLSSNTPAAASVPMNVSVEMMKINITAGNDGAASINGIKFSAAGLGNYGDIDQVTVYDNGLKLGNSRDVDSNKVAQINFTNALVVEKGTTKTLTVKAQVAGTQNYALSIDKASDISATSAIVGSFPVKSNVFSGVNVTVGGLTIDTDGSLSTVKLGDKAATLAKFKVTNTGNVEDITLNSITLKKDSASSAADSDFENMALYVDGTAVSSGAVISNKYVTFNLTSPITVLKNANKRFVVKGDVVGGAAKTLVLVLDSKADVNATGAYYGYGATIVNNLTAGSSVSINAGAVSIEKTNATNSKIKKDTTNVEFGSFKVTANSGKNVELSKMVLTIATSNDQQASSTAFAQIENLEVFNKTNNTVYDLSYVSGTASKVYSNTSMDLLLASGVTNELVVRADVKSTATSGDYSVSIANAATDMVLKETGNDTVITDITPNAVSLNKVTINAASLAFSRNAESASYDAVVGTSDIEVASINIKAGESSDVKITELKFMAAANADKTVISELKLWKDGVSTPIKTISASQLAGNEVTFNDLAQTISANTTAKYNMTVSLVKDSNNNTKTLNFRLSAYSAEETDKGAAIYDTTADSNSDGVILVGYTSLASLRTVNIKGTGSLNIAVDNTNDNAKYDTFALAGTTGNYVGAFKFKANNEDVKVTKLTITTSADISAAVSRLAVINATTGTEVAYTTSIGTTATVLDQDFTAPQTETTYYVKADFNKIGQNYAGANVAATFRLSAVEAEGAQSGTTLATNASGTLDAGELAYEGGTGSLTQTAVSKTVQTVASKIAGVDLVNNYSGQALASSITSGISANAAIIRVTVPTTSNNNNDGSDLKLDVNTIRVQVQTNASSTTATIEKIGGSDTAVTGVVSGGYATFDVSAKTDYQITPGTDAYFLVKVTPTFTATYSGQVAVKVGLSALDGGDFAWSDRVTSGASLTTVLIAGKSSVTGTEIKN